MNILILGSGGREHTLAWKLSQSPKLSQLFVAPGNAGTAQVAINLDISVTDFDAIKEMVLQHQIKLVIVGPEVPLVLGIHDFFSTDKDLVDCAIIGPKKEGAQLEGSKDFAKKFMIRHKIPTARYKSFTKDTLQEAFHFLGKLKSPYVLKADGLAAGKGVLIINDIEEAKNELTEILNNDKFGAAGTTVVIEEFLDGIEMSCFVLTDGKEYVILPNAKDYKRIGEGDTGLNTGGMGAVSPVPFADEAFMAKVKDRIVKPTIEGLRNQGLPYSGFIFFGLIKVDGDPFVIEYNVRMGDPESEVVIPRIESDLLEIMSKMGTPEFGAMELNFDQRAATTVMLVSGGYPESYGKGMEISGLDSVENSLVFHAGANKIGDTVFTSGGRVLAVTSLKRDWKKALELSYENAQKISFDKMYYRKDIGFDLH